MWLNGKQIMMKTKLTHGTIKKKKPVFSIYHDKVSRFNK